METTRSMVMTARGTARAARRASIGGFLLIEEDDFGRAMGQLLGMIDVEHPSASDRSTSASPADGTGRDGTPPPFWRDGKQLDLSPYTQEKLKPHTRHAVDHAISDPNPAPARGTLAIPPPYELMHPEGNVLVNRRIEMSLLHNEVATAQRVASSPGKLQQLLADPLFQRVCSEVGFTKDSLQPAPRSRFRVDPISGKTRTKEEISVEMARAEVDRLKKLALVLTDFRALALQAEQQKRKEAAARTHATVAAPMPLPIAYSTGPHAPEPLHLSSSSPLAAAARELEVADAGSVASVPSMPESFASWNSSMHATHKRAGGTGAGGGGDVLADTSPYARPVSRPSATRGSQRSDGASPAGKKPGSRGGAPNSRGFPQGPLTGTVPPASPEARAARSRSGSSSASSAAAAPGYSEDVLAEAAAVGLDPGVVQAYREEKNRRLSKIEALESKAVSLQQERARTATAGGVGTAPLTGLSADSRPQSSTAATSPLPRGSPLQRAGAATLQQ